MTKMCSKLVIQEHSISVLTLTIPQAIKQTLFLQIFGLVAFIEQNVFVLLDKGHKAENLQKECLFLLHYHFPMEDSSESFEYTTSS